MENIRILLIEDDKVDQTAFRRFVKDENLSYNYAIAGSVSEAKRVLDFERFDVVITDYFLGDGTAFDIFDSIIDIPIIVTTGSGDEEVAVKAMKAGAYDYLIKDPERNYLKVLPATVENAIKHKKAEEALRESEKQYRNLFENIPTGTYRTTPDGRIVMANPALIQMLGYSSFDELASRNLENEGFGANYPRTQFKELLETEGEVRGLESAWIRRDGAAIFVRENARGIRKEGGAILYYEGTVEDITERKRVDESLRETLAQLSKKNRYETIISTVTQSVHQSINLQDVLENAVDAMSKNIDGVDNVFVSLVEGEEAVLKAYRGYPDWFIERVRRIPYPKGATWKTIIEGKPRYCADADQDTVLGPAGREVGTKSYLSIPIHLGDKTVGVININSLQKNAFDEEELKLMEIVARQIETAINNARQAEELQQANEKLTRWVNELEQRNRKITLLNEMGELLQTCNTVKEAYGVIAQSARQLFPTESGALCVLNASRNLVETVGVWGESLPDECVFTPDECWALRRGQVYRIKDVHSGPLCRHLSRPLSVGYMCVPMMAQGKALGVLHLQNGSHGMSQPEEEMWERLRESTKQQLAVTVAEHIAMALANLKLRETLRNQAIRDSLTGLFNRRYMKESLRREVHRATRKGVPLGVIMLDIDHFKQFNDTFGHAAGDALLHELGVFLQTHIRREDIACRYGGEEFVLILPEASLDDTLWRAEQLREETKYLKVLYHGQFLGTVTLSLGVAVFPYHGSTAEALLRAADVALYRAKREGRDRVVMEQFIERETAYSTLTPLYQTEKN